MNMVYTKKKPMPVNKQMDEIETFVAKRLSVNRFRHVKGVQEVAICLAKKKEISLEKARLAGIFHDAYRELSFAEVLRRVKAANIPTLRIEEDYPILLHGPLAAFELKSRFGVDDESILQAIAAHTTGTAPMDELAKIIYVADLIEPNRIYPGVEALRETTEAHFEKGFIACLKHNMLHLINKERKIHPETLRCWNEYIK